MEIWKPIYILNYSQYEVSNHGNVKNIKTNHILSQHIRNGYKAVSLYDIQTKKSHTYNVHRLILATFTESCDKHVNHKNGIKTDNHIDNLEWMTPKENTSHAIKTQLSKPHPKKVKQYTTDGIYIQTYNSIIEASEKSGANDRHISSVCKGKRKTSGGFIWKYDTEEDIILDTHGVIIPDFPNYKITNDGKIYSKKARNFLKPKVLPNGYLSVKLCCDGICKDFYIHKLIRTYINESLDSKSI